MKKLLLIAALALAAITMRAQERISDTVVNGTIYAMLTGLSGSVDEYAEATVVDAAALTADLNNRLRKIAVYEAVAVPCAVASPLALYAGYSKDNQAYKVIGCAGMSPFLKGCRGMATLPVSSWLHSALAMLWRERRQER